MLVFVQRTCNNRLLLRIFLPSIASDLDEWFCLDERWSRPSPFKSELVEFHSNLCSPNNKLKHPLLVWNKVGNVHVVASQLLFQ